MLPSILSPLLAAAVLFGQSLARTDLSGCVSSTAISPAGTSLIWYVPGTGETCDFLDCGGGRAPPKTTVPGCAAYSGTATYSPSYLPGYGQAASTSSIVAVSSTTSASSLALTSMAGSQTATWSASGITSSLTTDLPSSPTASSKSSYLSSSSSLVQPTSNLDGSSSTAISTSASSKAASSTATASSASVSGNSGSSIRSSDGFLSMMVLVAALLR